MDCLLVESFPALSLGSHNAAEEQTSSSHRDKLHDYYTLCQGKARCLRPQLQLLLCDRLCAASIRRNRWECRVGGNAAARTHVRVEVH